MHVLSRSLSEEFFFFFFFLEVGVGGQCFFSENKFNYMLNLGPASCRLNTTRLQDQLTEDQYSTLATALDDLIKMRVMDSLWMIRPLQVKTKGIEGALV